MPIYVNSSELSESSIFSTSCIVDVVCKNVFVDFGSVGSNICLNICNNLLLCRWIF